MAPFFLDKSLIRGIDIFREMKDADLDSVLAAACVRHLPQGTVVFTQGAPAAKFFCLLSGHLKVVQTTKEGQQVVVRHINPGDIFGIAKALRRPDYPATAIAIVDSLALAWPSSEWDEFIVRTPVFALNALHAVGQRLQDAHERILELSTREVERRVASALLRLVQQAGRKTEEGILIGFPVTRQDIAEMTATTLHTVSRVMTGWQAKGLVLSSRKRVVVIDVQSLRSLAEHSDS